MSSRLVNVNGNDVKEVRSSQASKAMAHGFNDVGELEKKIAELEQQREAAGAEKREAIQALTDLKIELKSSLLDQRRLWWVQAERQRITKRLTALDQRLTDINNEYRPLLEVKREVTGQNTNDGVMAKLRSVQDDVREIKRLLEQLLKR